MGQGVTRDDGHFRKPVAASPHTQGLGPGWGFRGGFVPGLLQFLTAQCLIGRFEALCLSTGLDQGQEERRSWAKG